MCSSNGAVLAVQMEVRGPVVQTLYQHFVERWIHALVRDLTSAREGAIRAVQIVQNRRDCFWHGEHRDRIAAHTAVAVEVVRSWPFVVGGDSLLNAFVSVFRRAKRYIYIENQYALQAWPLVATLLRVLHDQPELRVIIIAPITVDLPSGYVGTWLDASQDHST